MNDWSKKTEHTVQLSGGKSEKRLGYKFKDLFFVEKHILNYMGYVITHIPSSVLIFPMRDSNLRIFRLSEIKMFVYKISLMGELNFPSSYDQAIKEFDIDDWAYIRDKLKEVIEGWV